MLVVSLAALSTVALLVLESAGPRGFAAGLAGTRFAQLLHVRSAIS